MLSDLTTVKMMLGELYFSTEQLCFEHNTFTVYNADFEIMFLETLHKHVSAIDS